MLVSTSVCFYKPMKEGPGTYDSDPIMNLSSLRCGNGTIQQEGICISRCERDVPAHAPVPGIQSSVKGKLLQLHDIAIHERLFESLSTPIIYSFGIYNHAEFELSLCNRYRKAEIYMFDPTPVAASYVGQLRATLLSRKVSNVVGPTAKSFEHTNAGCDPNNLRFFEVALAAKDSILKFYRYSRPGRPPIFSADPTVVMRGIHHDGKPLDVIGMSFNSAMQNLGHTEIHLLKIDVEGYENEVIKQVVSAQVRPKMIFVDFDSARQNSKGHREAAQSVQDIISFGYRCCGAKYWDLTFARTDVADSLECKKECAYKCTGNRDSKKIYTSCTIPLSDTKLLS